MVWQAGNKSCTTHPVLQKVCQRRPSQHHLKGGISAACRRSTEEEVVRRGQAPEAAPLPGSIVHRADVCMWRHRLLSRLAAQHSVRIGSLESKGAGAGVHGAARRQQAGGGLPRCCKAAASAVQDALHIGVEAAQVQQGAAYMLLQPPCRAQHAQHACCRLSVSECRLGSRQLDGGLRDAAVAHSRQGAHLDRVAQCGACAVHLHRM